MGPAASAQTAAGPYDPQANYLVTTTADGADAAIGNGVCRTASGACSLRAALQEAAVDRATSTIKFKLAAGARITPRSALPAISDLAGPTIIDGRVFGGSGADLVVGIELRGRPGFNGLAITSPDNAVYGLAIYGFRNQIRITGWNNRIEDNYLGTDGDGRYAADPPADPTQDLGGVLLDGDAANNAITNNLIAGNADIGVLVRGTASANTITHNAIGVLPPTGYVDCAWTGCPAGDVLPNRSHGVVLSPMTRFNVVGGGGGNVIGGNGGAGVQVGGILNRVSDNEIGVRGRFTSSLRRLPNLGGNVTVVGGSTEARITQNFMVGHTVAGDVHASVRIGDDRGDPAAGGITGTRVADNTIGEFELRDPLSELGVGVWQGSYVEIVQNWIRYHDTGLLIRTGLPTPVTQIGNVFQGNRTNVRIAE